MRPLTIIVAVDEVGGFGKNRTIPWDYPEDRKHFQNTTKGGICIMGRRTYEDMVQMAEERKEKAKKKTRKKKAKKKSVEKKDTSILPDRECWVVSRNPEFTAEGATVASDPRQVIDSLSSDDKREVFILGGEKLFISALPWTTTIYMTIVPGNYDCNRKFPLEYLKNFEIIEGREEGELKFVKYSRKT